MKKLEYAEFDKSNYYLTSRSLEWGSIPAKKDKIKIKVIDIDHTNSWYLKGAGRYVAINALCYPITTEEKIEVVEYKGNLYHTILTDEDGNIYLR